MTTNSTCLFHREPQACCQWTRLWLVPLWFLIRAMIDSNTTPNNKQKHCHKIHLGSVRHCGYLMFVRGIRRVRFEGLEESPIVRYSYRTSRFNIWAVNGCSTLASPIYLYFFSFCEVQWPVHIRSIYSLIITEGKFAWNYCANIERGSANIIKNLWKHIRVDTIVFGCILEINRARNLR